MPRQERGDQPPPLLLAVVLEPLEDPPLRARAVVPELRAPLLLTVVLELPPLRALEAAPELRVVVPLRTVVRAVLLEPPLRAAEPDPPVRALVEGRTVVPPVLPVVTDPLVVVVPRVVEVLGRVVLPRGRVNLSTEPPFASPPVPPVRFGFTLVEERVDVPAFPVVTGRRSSTGRVRVPVAGGVTRSAVGFVRRAAASAPPTLLGTTEEGLRTAVPPDDTLPPGTVLRGAGSPATPGRSATGVLPGRVPHPPSP